MNVTGCATKNQDNIAQREWHFNVMSLEIIRPLLTDHPNHLSPAGTMLPIGQLGSRLGHRPQRGQYRTLKEPRFCKNYCFNLALAYSYLLHKFIWCKNTHTMRSQNKQVQ